MADVFRDGAFPRKIDRIIIRTEAIIFLLGSILLIFFIRSRALDAQERRSNMRAVVEVIASNNGIIGLGIIAGVLGAYALWAVWRKKVRHIERAIFGFFMVRLYTLLATILTLDGVQDTRWINHVPWVIIWGAYFLVARLRVNE